MKNWRAGLGALAVCCWGASLFAQTDLKELAKAPPGQKVSYGTDALQFGELTLPAGPGPHPVVINIHGGCWLASYNIDHSRALANALAREGFAVWNLEYRRVGNQGGGWPNTFLDVGAGADYIRSLAAEHPLDLSRVVAMGHSAGGHFALWLAARKKIPTGSELHAENPITIKGVVALAPAPELDNLHEKGVCGKVVEKLMEGSPADRAQRYRDAMPSAMAPIGVPQILIIGKLDDSWRPIGEAYAEKAKSAGDTQIEVIVAPESNHSEVIDPGSTTWPLVLDAARKLLNQN